MRAVVCREQKPGAKLELEDWPLRRLGPADIHVRLRAAGVNFPDRLMVDGAYHVATPPPFVPGMEAAGEVLAVGADVTDLRPGDRVMIDGSAELPGLFAEECVFPRALAYPMPAGLDFAEAAALPVVYATGYHALVQRGALQPGETLLVHGAAGGTGLSALHIGAALGAKLIATVGSATKRDALHALGFEHVIDSSIENVRDRVLEITGKRGVDVVYDPVGGDLFDASVRCMAKEARLLVIGFTSGRFATMASNISLVKEISMVGVLYGAWKGRHPVTAAENMARIGEMVAAGKFRPHIWRKFGLGETREALESLGNRSVIGKTVLICDQV